MQDDVGVKNENLRFLAPRALVRNICINLIHTGNLLIISVRYQSSPSEACSISDERISTRPAFPSEVN